MIYHIVRINGNLERCVEVVIFDNFNTSLKSPAAKVKAAGVNLWDD